MTSLNPPGDSSWRASVADFLSGRRLMLDASVLLSAMLLPDSPSAALVELADKSVFLLSPHVEEIARRALRAQARERLGEFGDAIVRFATQRRVERTRSGDAGKLGSLRKGLSPEDAQVLADALLARADILYTHDEQFFRLALTHPVAMTPSAHTWNPFTAGNPYLALIESEWTFLGIFHPNWDSASLRGTGEEFYIFEVSDYLRCVYIAGEERFVVSVTGSEKPVLQLPCAIRYQQSVFVAFTAGDGRLTLYVDEQVAERKIVLPPAPVGARLAPFNSARGTNQIFGTVSFRLANLRLGQRTINRHCRTRSVLITDGEIDFANLATAHPLLHMPRRRWRES